MMNTNGTTLRAAGSGLVGALTLTLINETARQIVPNAPRLDLLGMQSLQRLYRRAGAAPPQRSRLRTMALSGDILTNTLYYGLVAAAPPKRRWLLGAALGAVAGLGAALLPPVFGLNRQPGRSVPRTPLMKVAWYTTGGLAAGAVAELIPSDI
jgi:hypothetical protein